VWYNDDRRGATISSGEIPSWRHAEDTLIADPVVGELKAGIMGNGIDAMIIDPFVSCHRVAENDNPAIDAVVKKFAEIADETGCSVNLEPKDQRQRGYG